MRHVTSESRWTHNIKLSTNGHIPGNRGISIYHNILADGHIGHINLRALEICALEPMASHIDVCRHGIPRRVGSISGHAHQKVFGDDS
ncbi:hypothetical protein D3C72_1395810 [compost metagenome]